MPEKQNGGWIFSEDEDWEDDDCDYDSDDNWIDQDY